MEDTSTPTMDEMMAKYLETLDAKTRQTLEIAKQHLETSFDLKKSIDFLKWKENNYSSTKAN